MPTVTALKQQQKRPDRVSVYIDGKYSFSLTSAQLSQSGIASGQALSDNQIVGLQQSSEVGKAVQAAFGLLSYRSRSRQELTERLSRKGYDETTIMAAIDRLQELKLIDDEDFANAWVQQTKSATRSRRRLQQELRQKGVDGELIKSQIEIIGEDHDYEAIKQLIKRRLNKNTAGDRRKLMEYLARQGFSYTQVKQVLGNDFSEIDWQ